MNKPMTGLPVSLFTPAAALYARLIPTGFNSHADASVMRSVKSGDPAIASAIAPVL